LGWSVIFEYCTDFETAIAIFKAVAYLHPYFEKLNINQGTSTDSMRTLKRNAISIFDF
jgi:hypothetical protein